MKLFCVTLTGADDTTDPSDLISLSQAFPFAEWAILLSETSQGAGRFPSRAWLNKLINAVLSLPEAHRPRLAAHLCGQTMRRLMEGETDWLDAHDLDRHVYNTLFSRTQLNFNAGREKFTPEKLTAMFTTWGYDMTGALITQEHGGNIGVSDVIQDFEMNTGAPVIRIHHVLHDASGGRGIKPTNWPQPIAGVLNGFAGGITPENVIESLQGISAAVGRGYAWIDLETGLRDAQDRFDLSRARSILEQIAAAAPEHGWLAARQAA